MTNQEIHFDYRSRSDYGVHEVIPCIDGIPLTDLIDRFETAARMDPAGDAYGGLIPEFYRFGPLEEHFHGRSTGGTGPKTPLLGCECGEWGCWPLMVGITVTDEQVVWDSFEQPYRKARDYSGFGPFRFDRRQYDDAVRVLSGTIGPDEA
ncbi:hypothetical protein [Kitasatospora viridis]|uniref:Uncharacterized protein n=1 Tax=Kitasatospora viridis TaxID=281105 RepID=A0A561TUV6_9ACTN|nr:hypothetical protein [Kitasatospora viridis]TWF90892.1 hypothetical protein FHX73_124 [Kitasatospora viridis]